MTGRIMVALLLTAGAAQAAESGLWHDGFGQGVTEYMTGQWDSKTGGALNLSCKDGRLTLMTQIKGEPPPGGSALSVTTNSRAGSREFRFATDAQGGVEMPASGFAALWQRLREDDTAVVRYADGRTEVMSLAGAGSLLPARPCG